MTPAEQYRRLPGKSGLLIRHSLWMKPDHLLRVRANPFSHQYRRYYFADIQALVLTELRSTAAFYWYAAAGSLALIGGLLVNAHHPVWGTLAGIISVLAFYLGWRVPNCSCYLKTSVSTDKLPSLRRLRAARKAIPAMIAEIEKAQGTLSRETLEAHPASGGAPLNFTNAPLTISHYGGQLHWLLFGLMLVDAALRGIVWTTRSSQLGVIAGSIGAAALLLAILAAFKQRRSDIPPGIRRVVYITLAMFPLNGIASVAVTMYLAVQLAAQGQKTPDTTAILLHPVYKIVVAADATWLVVLGCLGLVLMMLRKRSTHAPPPLVISENPGIGADGT